jgi:hypothetical protein
MGASQLTEMIENPSQKLGYRHMGEKKRPYSRKRLPRLGAERVVRGRKSQMSDRIEEIRQLFKDNGNKPLHYRRIMKNIPHQIKSERTFYQIAHEVLEETENAGFYVCYRDYENINLVMRNSEELKGFMELRSRNQLYGFIPRKSESPKDSVPRSLDPNAPEVLTDDKRFPPSFSRNQDRLKGAIIYGVKSEKSSKKEESTKGNRDDAEMFLRLLKCATGLLNPGRFMSLIPEAFMLAFRNGKADSGLLEGSSSFSDLSKDELDDVRRFAFGSAERIYALYTFDVNEAFDWFYANRSTDAVMSQLKELLREYKPEYADRWGERGKQEKSLREMTIDNSQSGEMLMKKLRDSSKSSAGES